MYRNLLFTGLVLLLISCSNEQKEHEFPVSSTAIYDSGGELMPEQAKFNVTYYDLNLKVEPDQKWIGGSLGITSIATADLQYLVLQLDTLLTVSKVSGAQGQELNFRAKNGLLEIDLGKTIRKDEKFSATIEYSGKPLAVENAERYGWADGFFWEKTEAGLPWVGNVSVLNGADIWFPCKDHPSDEPDSMAITVTVDNQLKVASNGRLREVVENEDGTDTYKWFVSTPINNYSVTVNIAPYVQLDTLFTSVAGEIFPFSFWTLPEHEQLARKQFPHFVDNMRFLEELLGPYPFRIDKYGSAETYYLGMENQSIIAYGSKFELNEWGFDWLHFHELTHEWFASLVTAEDWQDWWVHEGTTSYIESLYAEHLDGDNEATYLAFMSGKMKNVRNERPVVLSYKNVSAREGYHGDVYSKGASLWHTLRHVIGKEKTIELLRTLTYPTEESKKAVDGSHLRYLSTEDVIAVASSIHGENLQWLFDAYLYHAKPPTLVVESLEDRKLLQWVTGSDLPFTMTVPVKVGDQIQYVEMPDGKGELAIGQEPFEIDPEGRIYFKLSQKE